MRYMRARSGRNGRLHAQNVQASNARDHSSQNRHIERLAATMETIRQVESSLPPIRRRPLASRAPALGCMLDRHGVTVIAAPKPTEPQPTVAEHRWRFSIL